MLSLDVHTDIKTHRLPRVVFPGIRKAHWEATFSEAATLQKVYVLILTTNMAAPSTNRRALTPPPHTERGFLDRAAAGVLPCKALAGVGVHLPTRRLCELHGLRLAGRPRRLRSERGELPEQPPWLVVCCADGHAAALKLKVPREQSLWPSWWSLPCGSPRMCLRSSRCV